MSEHDTVMQDGAVCPHCGHNHDTSNLCDRNAMDEGRKVISCDHCGKDFEVYGYVSWHFTTHKLP